MTDTGGEPGPEGSDTPTPSQGIPQVTPPAQPGTPAGGTPATPHTPAPGWQSPGQPAPPPSGYGPQGAVPPHGALPPYQGGAYQQWTPAGLGKPGVIALRPLNVGDIFDGAITAMRRHALLIFGTSAVIAVISTAANLLVQLLAYSNLQDFANTVARGQAATDQELQRATLGFLGSTALLLIPAVLISILTRGLLAGFLTVVMGRAVLGRPAGFKDVMQEFKPRLLPLLGLTILYTLAVFGASLLCLLPAVIPYIFWALAGPALVLERGTIRESFSRSVKLVSGSFWRVLGILLLATVVAYVLSTIIQLPFGAASMFNNLFNPRAVPVVPGTGTLLLESVGTLIAETVVTPFTALVTVLVYIDQRMRREGMDIELARAAGLTPPAPPQQAW